VPLAIGEQRTPRFGERGVQADRRHRVLQCATFAHVHVHVAACDHGKAKTRRQCTQLFRSSRIVRSRDAVGCDPRPPREHRSDPRRIAGVACRIAARHPQRQQPIERPLEIRAQGAIRPLSRAPPRHRDQLAQRAIAVLRFRQQHQLRPILDRDLAADDQGHAGRFRCLQRPHDAGERTLVGDRECRVPLLLRAFEQLLRAGRARAGN
jgi:hypothetical protein